MKFFFILMALWFTSFSGAAGLVSIQGRLVSLTQEEVQIQTGKNIYTINKSALSKEELDLISNPKKNGDLRIHVPLRAINSSRPAKK